MRTVWIGAVAVAVAFAIIAPSIGLEGQSVNSLVGAWKVAEIVSPQGQVNSSPQPTIYIFTSRHYGHVSVTSTTPRPDYTGPNTTDAQRVEMWQPFSATAGSYELRAKELTIKPMVAKNPGFMHPGSFTTFEWTMADRNTAWIRATAADTGPIPATSANRVKLLRLE